MNRKKAKRYKSLRRVLKDMRLSLLAFGVLVCLALFGVLIIRRSLLINGQETGAALARSYAEEARSNLTVYQTLLSYGTAFLQDRLDEGYTAEDLFEPADMYFERVTSVLGEGVVSPFLLVGDEMLTASGRLPTDIDPDYDARQRDWYRMAVAEEGKVVVTGLYTDIVTEEPVISVVQSFDNGNVVLGFDVFTENFHFQADPLTLAHADSFFLCDATGKVLYSRTGLPLDSEGIQKYCSCLLEKIYAGELDEYCDFIKDLDGDRRGVYYTRMENGWYSIVTIPYRNLLGNLRPFGSVLAMILGVSLLVLAVTVWREKKYHDRIDRTDETVVLLSKLDTKQHIEVELNLDELDLTAAESKATYEEIKEYVLEHTGLKVSHLYIAQVKQKYGIIERENYNKPKSENSKQPKCPPEKEAAITEALKYFGMI